VSKRVIWRKNISILIRFVLRSMNGLRAGASLFRHTNSRSTKKVAELFARFVRVTCEKSMLKLAEDDLWRSIS